MINFSQEQLTNSWGVAYGKIGFWERSYVQPLPLALLQIKAVLADLVNLPELQLHELGKNLLTKYFLAAE
ncbi:hypothetical protein [Fortiea contorta]|uniref:hypothetical protein n=1 Tax=Fortiea contorta TaxID=1892405 RepID=UPI0003492C2F|nr:hypothetical protein [Fortiea contorta]